MFLLHEKNKEKHFHEKIKQKRKKKKQMSQYPLFFHYDDSSFFHLAHHSTREHFRAKGASRDNENECPLHEKEECVKENHPDPVTFRRKCTPLVFSEKERSETNQPHCFLPNDFEDPCFLRQSGMLYAPTSCQDLCCSSSQESSSSPIQTQEEKTFQKGNEKRKNKNVCLLL